MIRSFRRRPVLAGSAGVPPAFRSRRDACAPSSPPSRALRFALVAAALAGCSQPEPAAPTAAAAAPEPPGADLTTALLLGETAELHRQERYEEGIARLSAELDRDPDRLRLHYNLGVFRASSGDYEGAAAMFEEELARFGEHTESHRALAAAYTRLDRLDDSIGPFESCLRAAPDDAVCAFGLGRNLSVLGLLDDAVPHLEHAADLRRDAAAFAELGLLHRRRGDLQRAAAAFAEAMAADPRHLPTVLGYGQTLMALRRSEEGEALLERHRRLAALNDQLDAFERARQQQDPPADAFRDLARLHLERDDRPAAIAAFEESLTRDPTDAAAALELAALYLDAGQLADAERAIGLATAADPQSPAPGFYLGLLRLKQGDGEAAARAFAESLGRAGWPAQAFVDLGAAYREAGDLERAAAAYLEALRLEPENPRAHYGVALASRDHGDRESARKAATRAIELDPGYAEAWTLLGVLRFKTGDAAGAETAFRRAIDLERLTLLRADGADRLLADFPGEGGARVLYRRLLYAPVADGIESPEPGGGL